MARGGQLLDSNISLCPVCDRRIDIFNNDVPFSMELHMQSHKPFKIISEEMDNNLKGAKVSSNCETNCESNLCCPQCKEDIKIFNNDISTSLRLHSQKHNSGASETLSGDQLSTSSTKSQSSSKDVYSTPRSPPRPVTSILDSIFSTMPQGLKCHRGYVMENSNGKSLCCLCNVQIELINGISDHLKTKLHEDNIIFFLKKIMPNNLHQVMEFISFYGSSLCCNLCKCKIDLCSTNPHETIVNIMAHNISKAHLKNKHITESSCYSDQASITVKSLAQINPLIDKNKHFISCEMEPKLKCKLCNKHFKYSQSDNKLLINLTAHFKNQIHKTSVKAISILESFKSFDFVGKEKHNFIISNGAISCTVCKCSIKVKLEALVSHVKETKYVAPKYESLDLSSRISHLSLDTPSNTSNQTITKDQYITSTMQDNVGQEPEHKEIVDLNILLKSLPAQFKNINYVIKNDHGEVTCLICNCVISANTHNLETHLLGSKHRKKEQTTPIITAIDSNQSNKTVRKNSLIIEGSNTTSDGDRKYSFANTVVLLNNLLENDPFIKTNVKQYLVINNDHYSCSICKSKIQMSYKEEHFREHLMYHFGGAKHKKKKKKEKKIQNLVQLNLLSLDPIDNVNKKYLEKQGDKIVCILCNATITSDPLDEKSLNANHIPHLTGKTHLKQLKKLLKCGVANSTSEVQL